MDEYLFSLNFQVRDYECDQEGIVNNAIYQNYLEHTRHEFFKTRGVDFSELVQKGIHLVVVRVELDYKYPLRSGDQFLVGLNIFRESKLKFTFLQDIYRLSDKKLILKGKVVGVALNQDGRPCILEELGKII